MAIVRQITCIKKRNEHHDPHEIIESIGGEYLGSPWRFSHHMAIYYVKEKLEKYYIIVNGKRIKVVVGNHNGKEYLKTEADRDSPDSLLALAKCQ
jgi:hypothetical protein